MNKYQEALTNIEENTLQASIIAKNYRTSGVIQVRSFEALQELVDKSTPKNVDLSCDTLTCPYCETGRIYDWENEKRFKYCADCGQALDWSTDE